MATQRARAASPLLDLLDLPEAVLLARAEGSSCVSNFLRLRERISCSLACQRFNSSISRDGEILWINKIASLKARRSAMRCFDLRHKLRTDFAFPMVWETLRNKCDRLLLLQKITPSLPMEVLRWSTNEHALVLFMFGLVPVEFVQSLPSTVHVKLFLTNEGALAVIENGAFDATAFQRFREEIENPLLAFKAALLSSFKFVRDQDSKNLVLATVGRDTRVLQYATADLEDYKNLFLVAAAQNGLALQYASPEIKACKPLFLAAVARNGLSIRFASLDLRADPELMLAAVKQNGLALQYASQAIKADRGAVLQAVKQNGRALQFASFKLRATESVVKAALDQNGEALQFASDDLKADMDMVCAAVAQSKDAARFASDDLRVVFSTVPSGTQESPEPVRLLARRRNFAPSHLSSDDSDDNSQDSDGFPKAGRSRGGVFAFGERRVQRAGHGGSQRFQSAASVATTGREERPTTAAATLSHSSQYLQQTSSGVSGSQQIANKRPTIDGDDEGRRRHGVAAEGAPGGLAASTDCTQGGDIEIDRNGE